MNRLEIPDAGITIDIPASYDEMSGEQVLYVMQLLNLVQIGKITVVEFKVRVLYYLLGMKHTAKPLHPDDAQARNENVVLLCEQLLGFIFTENDGELFPAYDSIVNHIPKLRIGNKTLIAPADGLLDLSFAEVRAADAELLLYSQTKDESHLNNMIACLYREEGAKQPSGRAIIPYSDESIDKYSKMIGRVPKFKKMFILLWYTSNIHYLQTGTYTIDGREICFEPIFRSEGGGGKSLGWSSILYDLAEKRTFGDIQQTDSTSIVDVLTLLLHYKISADNVRKAHKSH